VRPCGFVEAFLCLINYIMRKQYYCDYWEDYQHGFYNTNIDNEEEFVLKSIKLLSNKEKFNEKCRLVLDRWVHSSKVNLTNEELNQVAWLGQAACCYHSNSPNYITRLAWNRLDIQTQRVANRIARRCIKDYKIKLYENECTQKKIEF
jgi:hypothetical protein